MSSLLKNNCQSFSKKPICTLIVCFLITSVSSYPFESSSLIIILSICLGILFAENNKVLASSQLLSIPLSISLLLLLPHYDYLKQLPNQTDIMSQRVTNINDDVKKIAYLEYAAEIIPSTGLLCDLGDSYLKAGYDDKAIKCFQCASWMVPRRLTPRYKLFMYYFNHRDYRQALSIAKEIQRYEPYYIRGTSVITMLNTIKSCIKEIKDTRGNNKFFQERKDSEKNRG